MSSTPASPPAAGPTGEAMRMLARRLARTATWFCHSFATCKPSRARAMPAPHARVWRGRTSQSLLAIPPRPRRLLGRERDLPDGALSGVVAAVSAWPDARGRRFLEVDATYVRVAAAVVDALDLRAGYAVRLSHLRPATFAE